MKTKKQKKTDDSEAAAIFARIPLEKLSGMDETLWLEQISVEKAKKNIISNESKENS